MLPHNTDVATLSNRLSSYNRLTLYICVQINPELSVQFLPEGTTCVLLVDESTCATPCGLCSNGMASPGNATVTNRAAMDAEVNGSLSLSV